MYPLSGILLSSGRRAQHQAHRRRERRDSGACAGSAPSPLSAGGRGRRWLRSSPSSRRRAAGWRARCSGGRGGEDRCHSAVSRGRRWRGEDSPGEKCRVGVGEVGWGGERVRVREPGDGVGLAGGAQVRRGGAEGCGGGRGVGVVPGAAGRAGWGVSGGGGRGQRTRPDAAAGPRNAQQEWDV